ncbi:MAG: DUF2961 domain-containing protein [Acidobacteria bacterium]|nr:MAG: DUF2961 domain-containing protein [Acidobacteriota bacterium]REK08536.1 MAG: DUF2961 domain-containing protein [Acidobacteriota bacterium]
MLQAAFDARAPYDLGTGLESRSISFENPTGARGAGGVAASPLGPGRKGSPSRVFAPGETVELAAIEGPGTVRHIWMTMPQFPEVIRSMVLRFYWDGQEHPSIEAPVGDFFGFAHGTTDAFQSAVHSVGERLGMNIWLPMPFASSARVTLTNELPIPMMVYFQLDYTLGDRHSDGFGRLHVAFDRHAPTTLREDLEVLPRRTGRGRYLGAVIGVRPLPTPVEHPVDWWGEGEIKIYLDGDEELPTINGTGAEDYVGLSYGIQETPFLHHGANWIERDEGAKTESYVSMYRWHLADPIYWDEEIRVTLQTIGCCATAPPPMAELLQDPMGWYMSALFERQDDYSVAAFWYEPVPSAPLPPMPDREARIADLPASGQPFGG